MLKACFFDLDGTIINSIVDISIAGNNALEKNGLKTHDEEAYQLFLGYGVNMLITHMLGGSSDEALFVKVKNDYLKYYNEHCCVKTIVYDEIITLLEFLSSKGIKLFISTNKDQKQTDKIVKKLFSNINFEKVYGRDQGAPEKQSPGVFSDILESHNLLPDECLYIGDTEVDVKTAESASVRCIAVSWGYRSESIFQPYNPYRLFKKPEELMKYFITYFEK